MSGLMANRAQWWAHKYELDGMKKEYGKNIIFKKSTVEEVGSEIVS